MNLGTLKVSKTVGDDGVIEIVIIKRIRVLPNSPTITKEELEAVPDPVEECGLISIEATNQSGVTTYTYTFRSVQAGAPGVAVGPGGVGSATIKHLDGSTKTVPITMHESFGAMYAQYGKNMKNGRVEWLEKSPGQSGGALSTAGSSTINPLYGVESYQAAGSVYSFSKRYPSRSIDVDLATLVGKIVIPEGLDDAKDGEWIGLSVSIRSHGSGYIVEKKYLRDARKWLEELYR